MFDLMFVCQCACKSHSFRNSVSVELDLYLVGCQVSWYVQVHLPYNSHNVSLFTRPIRGDMNMYLIVSSIVHIIFLLDFFVLNPQSQSSSCTYAKRTREIRKNREEDMSQNKHKMEEIHTEKDKQKHTEVR